MKSRAILAASLAAVLSLTMLAGCSFNRGNDTSSGTGSGSSSMTSSGSGSSNPDHAGTESGNDNTGNGENPGTVGPTFFGMADEKLTKAYEAARKAVGDEGFILNPMDDSGRLEEAYGVSTDLVDSAIVEIPMMSAHVGTFIGVKAKQGKGEEVEKALTTHRDKIAEDEMQYPMNAMKTKAGQVFREGDYVFYMMLGSTSNETTDMEDADQLSYYQGENKKAVDAIKEALKA